MYIYIYMYTYIYIYIYVYVCVWVCVSLWVWVSVNVWVCASVSQWVWVCECVNECVSVWVCECVSVWYRFYVLSMCRRGARGLQAPRPHMNNTTPRMSPRMSAQTPSNLSLHHRLACCSHVGSCAACRFMRRQSGRFVWQRAANSAAVAPTCEETCEATCCSCAAVAPGTSRPQSFF